MKPMSSKEYADNSGMLCPYCGGCDTVATESVQMDGGIGTQEIECNDCHKIWTDIVKVVGYRKNKYE